MHDETRTWPIVIAGEHAEQRWAALTAPERLGEMNQLIGRARTVGSIVHTCVVGSARFDREWRDFATHLPSQNLFIHDAGEAIVTCIARCLREVERRDPAANVILIPADHCATLESSWVRSAEAALQLGTINPHTVYVLHDKPDNDPRISGGHPDVCSSSVMIGATHSLLELCAGNRSTAIVDLNAEPTMRDTHRRPAARDPGVPIDVVHIRSVEEYAYLQKGDYASRTALHVDVRA